MADLNSTNKIIDKALTALSKNIAKVEPAFAKMITEWVSEFNTKNGNLSTTKGNTQRLAGFKAAIDRFLIKSGYSDMVGKFLKSYPPLTDAIRAIHKDLSDLDIAKKDVNVFQQNAIKTVRDSMVGQGLNAALVNPIQNELFIAVNQGSSLTDVIKSITTQVSTTETNQGIIKRLALQTSRDSLGQYEGVVNEAVRKKFGLDAFIYFNSLVKDSRPQCERWVDFDKNNKKGLILFSELESEIEWALNNGTGFIKDTTPENFAQNRGGYNCRHVAYPVRSSAYLKKQTT
jgi:hypothetical protein